MPSHEMGPTESPYVKENIK